MSRSSDRQVFISYVRSDEKWARDLSHELSEAGIRVIAPFNELLPGDNWFLKIGQALEESEAMIVLISPEAAQSDWLRGEIQYALGEERFEGRLIPVKVKPTDDFPWILRKMKWVVGSPAEAGRRIVKILEEVGNSRVHADAH